MRPSDAVGLYRRRGSVVLWEHANPLDPSLLDPITGTPRLTAGGRRRDLGKMGETFEYAYSIIGYLQSKSATTFSETYGYVDDRQLQFTVPAQHSFDIGNGIRPLPEPLLSIYEQGKFVVFSKSQALGRDRFTINGQKYVVKAAAVPIIDQNTTIAWRMFLAADTL